MAIFKVVSPKGHYKDVETYLELLKYLYNPQKTPNRLYVERGISSRESAALEMAAVTSAFGKNDGTKVRHSILSFAPEEQLSRRDAYEIAYRMTDYYADKYQIVAVVHENKSYLHIHLVMNTVSFVDGRKYAGKKDDYRRFLAHTSNVLKEKRLILQTA